MFKVKDDELTFSRAVEIAVETDDAAKVAKETDKECFKQQTFWPT